MYKQGIKPSFYLWLELQITDSGENNTVNDARQSGTEIVHSEVAQGSLYLLDYVTNTDGVYGKVNDAKGV